MGKMIIVASGKGGTGKTTLTSQIGMWLSSLGYLTVLVDADAGFRNLDIALGLESSVVYDYSDFMSGTSDLDDILTKSNNSENLYFIAAPQSAKTSDFDTERVKLFWDSVKSRFDFVIADAPAGMGDGFMFAAEFADEAIIVSLAETPSLRDADRVIENLENKGIETIRLVLNRINPEQIANKVQINVDDCIDVLSIPILRISATPTMSASLCCASARWRNPRKRPAWAVPTRMNRGNAVTAIAADDGGEALLGTGGSGDLLGHIGGGGETALMTLLDETVVCVFDSDTISSHLIGTQAGSHRLGQ